jgi:hypothetical protein
MWDPVPDLPDPPNQVACPVLCLQTLGDFANNHLRDHRFGGNDLCDFTKDVRVFTSAENHLRPHRIG